MDRIKQMLLDMAIRQIAAHEQDIVDVATDILVSLYTSFTTGEAPAAMPDVQPPQPPPIVTPPKQPTSSVPPHLYDFGSGIPLEIPQ